jgi:hypothetical protein
LKDFGNLQAPRAIPKIKPKVAIVEENPKSLVQLVTINLRAVIHRIIQIRNIATQSCDGLNLELSFVGNEGVIN